MKKYQALLFDLDGTLTDSGPGILNSVRYALKKMGLPCPENLNSFIGPPLLTSFETFCHLSPTQSTVAVRCYREYFREKGIFENSVYEGIYPALQALQNASKTLVLATAKPLPFAEQILKHFHLDGYFSAQFGATMGEEGTTKAEVITQALHWCQTNQIQGPPLMIGDRDQDICGAKECHIDVCSVLWGYGDQKELAAADYLLSHPSELTKLI